MPKDYFLMTAVPALCQQLVKVSVTNELFMKVNHGGFRATVWYYGKERHLYLACAWEALCPRIENIGVDKMSYRFGVI